MNEIVEFTIVQCIPDPVADERINIGVIVLSGDTVMVRFVNNWRRTSRFFGEVSIGHIRDFAEAMELTAAGVPATPNYLPLFTSDIPSPIHSIRRMIDEWSQTIQFTPLQPSLEEPRRLLYRLADRYLKEPEAKRTSVRSKAQVISTAVSTLRSALHANASERPILDSPIEAKARAIVQGRRVKDVQVDFALVNGSPLGGGQAISFQINDMAELRAQRQQAVWSLADIMALNPSLTTSIMIAAPDPASSSFRRAGREYAEFRLDAKTAGIAVVEESEAEDWAVRFTEEVLASH